MIQVIDIGYLGGLKESYGLYDSRFRRLCKRSRTLVKLVQLAGSKSIVLAQVKQAKDAMVSDRPKIIVGHNGKIEIPTSELPEGAIV